MKTRKIKTDSIDEQTGLSFRRKPEASPECSGFRLKAGMTKNGSALILVVVVTVLLSVVGILFVMTARMREMTTANVTDDRDLDTGIQTLAGQIQTVLLQDLFGTKLTSSIIDDTPLQGNEAYDSSTVDPWLASLEPTWLNDNGTPANPLDDLYQWDHMTDLYGKASKWNGILRDGLTGWVLPQFGGIVEDYQDFGQCPKKVVNGQTVPDVDGFPADADGDGVADSTWTGLPDMSTSKGKPLFAAVRIIDNCAMLNLNTAYCFYQKPYDASSPESPFIKPWYVNKTAQGFGISYPNGSYYADGGRYLAEINYLPFLRGRDLNGVLGSNGDGWYNILAAKKIGQADAADNWTLTSPLTSICDYHQMVLMNIENPGPTYGLFDIGDELEIRNRSVMTSLTESRFERSDTGNFTFDAGGNYYVALRIPRDNSGSYPISDWTVRMNPANFDFWSGGIVGDAFKYDRRHLCTFYSFDRNIRTGSYLRLEAALNLLSPSVSASQKLAIEGVFRPTGNRPIDLRSITDPAKLDAVTNFLISITSNTPAARKNILHLLYAFREYYDDDIISEGGFSNPSQIKQLAARKAAQVVANMIDYLDDNDAATRGPFYGTGYQSQRNPNPTYITKAIVEAMILEASSNDPAVVGNVAFDFGLAPTDTIYGYERQPFISEVYCQNIASGTQVFALELVNPYDMPINLNGWRLCFGTSGTKCDLRSACNIPAAAPGAMDGRLIIWTANTGYSAPAITADAVYNTIISPTTAKGIDDNTTFGLGLPMQLPGNELRLQRPDPANAGQFITVDSIDETQRTVLIATPPPGPGNSFNVSSRDDKAWKFTNKSAYVNNNPATLGLPNSVTVSHKGYQLPVADAVASLDRLADFQKIIFIGNGVDPNSITSLIADAYTHDGESDIRFDYVSFPPLLKYLCTLNRPEGNLPGRININTAPVHVIAAAIPPQLVNAFSGDPNDALVIAGQIVSNRSYKDLGELLTKVPAMRKYDTDSAPDVGQPGIRHDFEERDWIINRLSNIFTVRSDTFTAYILVRLGTDGPQRRMLAIFDRSNCWSANDKPKIVALHLVPDPR
jgi:hypothetical protein